MKDQGEKRGRGNTGISQPSRKLFTGSAGGSPALSAKRQKVRPRRGDPRQERSSQEVPASPFRRVTASSSESAPVSRIFCAIEIPAPVRKSVAEHIARLRAAAPEARASWSREENIHLTLKFLGEIPTDRVEDLSRAAERAIASLTPFKLIVGGTGSFPSTGTPRILWVGIGDESGTLNKLFNQLESECEHEGFAREQRALQPHLTLARFRGPSGSPALAAANREIGFGPIVMTVTELSVIRSELSSSGSKYTVISRKLFTGSAGGPLAEDAGCQKSDVGFPFDVDA
jgi:2'-5' RNA ligase